MSSRVCVICTVPITVTRLGVEACRACAAFYKRSIIASRKFTCRQGNKICTIRKKDKFLCRSCRYDKCVEIGMIYEIPYRKLPRKKSYSSENELPALRSPMKSVISSESLLGRLQVEYQAFCVRRMRLEKEYVVSHNLPSFGDSENLFVGNFDSFDELFRIAIKESAALLRSVFHEFDLMPMAYQVIMFKNFVRNYYMLECLYYTSKKLKTTSMFMSSLITCMEIGHSNRWTSNENDVINTGAFQSSLRGFIDDYTRLLTPLRIGELTDREFHALIGLIYCDIDTSVHVPDDLGKIVHKTRSKLFEELQEYYRSDLKIRDFSKRLGTVMTLTHGAKEIGNLMNEEMRMYSTFFDLYSNDRLFRELIS